MLWDLSNFKMLIENEQFEIYIQRLVTMVNLYATHKEFFFKVL